MLKKLFLVFLFVLTSSNAQTFVKLNTVTALVGVPNIGLETAIGKKTTFNVDVMASFWKSFGTHNPMQFYTLTTEIRYYFKDKFNGWYFGGHIGPDRFKLQKWNYFNTNKYEDGFGYRIGGTLGYQFTTKGKLKLDVFLSGGWHQGFYKGLYNDGTPGRYDKAINWNKSGEWLPYGGGIMLSYPIN